MIHHICHPFRLGNQMPIPEGLRDSFAIGLPARLVEADHVRHKGHVWIVMFVQFEDAYTIHVRVKYNGGAFPLRAVYEVFDKEVA